jgi:hypothetical protein
LLLTELSTARDSSTWEPIVVDCLICYPDNTFFSQRSPSLSRNRLEADCGSEGMRFDPHSGQSKVRLFSLSILTDKDVLVAQSCPPSTGSLMSVSCDQPPLICVGVCGRKAITKPNLSAPGAAQYLMFIHYF